MLQVANFAEHVHDVIWTPGACSVKFMYSLQYPLHKIPNFHLISWCGNFVDRHSFSRVSGDSPKLYGNCAFPQSFRTREFRYFTQSPEIFIRFSRKFAFYQSHWFHADHFFYETKKKFKKIFVVDIWSSQTLFLLGFILVILRIGKISILPTLSVIWALKYWPTNPLIITSKLTKIIFSFHNTT